MNSDNREDNLSKENYWIGTQIVIISLYQGSLAGIISFFTINDFPYKMEK